MAGFAAIEASIASGRPQAVICGSGPGTLGVLWAIAAGRSQGARVLVLVPRTPPVLADSVDIQESSYAYPLHAVGAELFDDVIALEHVDQMPRVALRVRQLFARPYGAVVQLTAPTDLLDCVCPPLPDFSRVTIAPAAPSTATIAEVRALLAGPGGPPAFLLGNGAGVFGERLGAVVARWGAVHFATPAAAGLLPGSLGVVGNAAYGDVPTRLRALDVRCVVVLGTRLGTASAGGDRWLLPPRCHVVHVDADPDLTAANALAVRDHPLTLVSSEIGAFLDALGEADTCRSPQEGAA